MKAALQYVQRASSSETRHSEYGLHFSRERVSKTDIEEKKLLNKVIIFVFFIYKNILIAS